MWGLARTLACTLPPTLFLGTRYLAASATHALGPVQTGQKGDPGPAELTTHKLKHQMDPGIRGARKTG